jgi:hypothetical protein
MPMPYARLPVVVRGWLPHTDVKRLPSMSTPPQSLRCWSYHEGEFQEGPVLGHLQDISPERRRCLAVVICTMDRPRSTRRLLDSVAAQTRVPDEPAVADSSADTSFRGTVAGQMTW